MTGAQKATMILSSPRMRSVKNINAKGAKKRAQKNNTRSVFIEENTRMRIQAEYHKIDGDEYLPHKI